MVATAALGVGAMGRRVRLKPRERECLELFGEGLSYQAIADRLGISFFTARAYLADARAKLEAGNSREALKFLRDRDNPTKSR